MEGGEISGNTATSYSYSSGGGVYVGSSGTFTMSDGEISGNTSSSGGGVYVGSSGTFRIVTGTVYGSGEGNLSNTANEGAAIYLYYYSSSSYGTAQRGTFSGETWNNLGDLSTTNDTIRVADGELR